MLVVGRLLNQGVFIGRGIIAKVVGIDRLRRQVKMRIDLDGTQEPAVVTHSSLGEPFHIVQQDAFEASVRAGEQRPLHGSVVMLLDVGQCIHVGRGISVWVLDVQSNDGIVRVGIEAPQHVAVSRNSFTLEQHNGYQDKRDALRGV